MIKGIIMLAGVLTYFFVAYYSLFIVASKMIHINA
jgi:hypothetical protein